MLRYKNKEIKQQKNYKKRNIEPVQEAKIHIREILVESCMGNVSH